MQCTLALNINPKWDDIEAFGRREYTLRITDLTVKSTKSSVSKRLVTQDSNQFIWENMTDIVH